MLDRAAGSLPPSQAPAALCPILVGRDHPFNALLALWAQARNGAGRLALIAGEAGVGKTRLLRELRVHLRADTPTPCSLVGHCFEPDQTVPYAAITDLLRTLYASQAAEMRPELFGRWALELARLLPEWVELIPGQQTFDVTLEPDQRRLLYSLTQLLAHLARTRPLVVLIEDVHWADPASLAFLQYLARRLAGQPWLLLLSYRPDHTGPALTQFLAELDRNRSATEISLAPLSATGTRQMVRAILEPVRPPAALVDTVFRLSEGNPFFIEELLQAWAAGEDGWAVTGLRDPAVELHLPRSIRATVQQRLSTLTAPADHVLRLAAVMGRHFDFPLLQHLTGLDEGVLLARLRELVQAQLVVEATADVFMFRHALTREAVYRDLLERERQTLHRNVLAALEALYPAQQRQQVMADLAFHAYQAGAWAKAMNYAQAAGRQAQTLHAPQLAVEHYTYALLSAQRLDLTPPPALYRARGQMYDLLGQFESACSDYNLALSTARQLNDRAAESQALLDLGFLWTGRDYAKAGHFFVQAVALARPVGDQRLLAATLNRVGLWHTHAERPLVGLRHHAEALALYRAEADLAGQAETLDLLGVTAYMSGDLSLGWSYFEEGIALCRRTGDRQRLVTMLFTGAIRGGSLLCDTLAWLAVPGEVCLRECAEAIAMAQAMPWPAGEAYAQIVQAHLLGMRGQMGAALTAAQTALNVAEEIEHGMWTLNAHIVLGALYLELLRPDLAVPHLKDAPAQARALGSTYVTCVATSYLSRAYLAQKQVALAGQCLEKVVTPELDCQTLAQRLVWAAETERLLAAKRPADALRTADRLIAATQASGPVQFLGQPVRALVGPAPRLTYLRGRALAALGRTVEALEVFQSASQAAEAFGALPILWRIQAERARLYLVAGDHVTAAETRAAALATIEAVAASLVEAAPASATFRTTAVASLPALRPAAYGARLTARRRFDGLTLREVDVARLVAQGRPNRAIATAVLAT